MTTEQRLARLERENRWMRTIGAAGITLVSAVFLMGQGKPDVHEVVVSRKFTMVDAKGHARGFLTTSPAGDSLFTLTSDKGSVALRAGNDGRATIVCADENDSVCVAMGRRADGTPHVSLHDSSGAKRAQMELDTRGHVTLALRAADGRVGPTARGAASFRLRNAQNQERFLATARPDGETYLVLMDKEGKDNWHAPKK